MEKIKWFDLIHGVLLLIMLIIFFFARKGEINYWFAAVGTSLFTIWTFLSTFKFGINVGRKPSFENYTFLFVFLVYSGLSILLALKINKIISVLPFVISLEIFVGLLFLFSFLIWVFILVRNKRSLFTLFLSYVVITAFLILIFMILYSLFGNFYINGIAIPKENISKSDYFYFSALTFTGMSYKDIYLIEGSSIFFLESYISMFFNVIIIGAILSRFFNRNKLDDLLKGKIKIKGIGKKNIEKLRKL
jgi:hypothetical protein